MKAHILSSVPLDFLSFKSQLYEKLRGKMNARQEKVIARLFREGPEGFKGSMPFRVETDERRVV
jgi:hypothetical protein